MYFPSAGNKGSFDNIFETCLDVNYRSIKMAEEALTQIILARRHH